MADEITKMDAQIKDIKITSAHFDKRGEIDRDEFATLTLKIPMDTDLGRKWVAGLFAHLSRDFVAVEVTEKQARIPGTATQSASLSAEDVENQLKVAQEAAD